MTADDITNYDLEKSKMVSSPNRLVVILSVVMFLGGICALIVGIVLGMNAAQTVRNSPCAVSDEGVYTTKAPIPGTTTVPGPTPSSGEEGHYRYAAVSTKTTSCSRVGIEIMGRKGGSAVDAAIATVLCAGAVTFESNGIGGGHFMILHKRSTKKTHAIMAREQAPAAASENMYVGLTGYNNSLEGGLAIAIPGEIMGFWEAHKIGGKLPWIELFQPTIKLCEEGFPMEYPAWEAMKGIQEAGYLDRHPNLRNLLTNPETNEYYKVGEKVRRPKYAKTLRIIATEGYQTFYNGSLATKIVKEIKDAGGIITEADMKSYFASVKEPLVSKLNNNMKVLSPPPPSGGLIAQFILNILNGYNITPYDLLTSEKSILTYHRIIEAFKFAFAKRSALGDPDVENDEFKDKITEMIKNLTSSEYGDYIRSRINDERTEKAAYYGPTFSLPQDAGTSHLSFLGPNGDAVSVTSTINTFFGSKIVGTETGIVYNNEMDDFSTPNTTNYFGVPASPSNFIKPGKRPLSSMSPTIVVDDNDNVVLVVGASGGTRIITAVALTTINTLWFNKGIKAAVDYPRIHHQLFPEYTLIEDGFPENVVKGLKDKGHEIKPYPKYYCSVQAVFQKKEGEVTANSDYRKNGLVDGY